MIDGKTTLYYRDGQGSIKKTRVLGRAFNRILRREKNTIKFFDAAGAEIKPEKNWQETAKQVRG